MVSLRAMMRFGGSGAVLMAGIVLFLLLNGSAAEAGGPPDGRADPCSCALLNFWDPVPRGEATDCCSALLEFCAERDSISCGHVHRFCLKHRAGYSAWVLDEFVKERLTPLDCPQYNPDATHADACGDGWCRIGYACTTVRADRCRQKEGVRCGNGFCHHKAQCGDTSTQECSKKKRKELPKDNGNKDIEISCPKGSKDDNDVCTVCEVEKEHECVLDNDIRPPCDGRGCADVVECGPEEESVCTIRPEALPFIGETSPKTHAPEKVPEHLRRFTAYVLPGLGVAAGTIMLVALASWGTIRIRRAKREAAMPDEDEDDENKGDTPRGTATARSHLSHESIPLSPATNQPNSSQNHPGLHLPLGAAKLDPEAPAPYSGRRSARSGLSGGRRLWTPRRGYQWMSNEDLDAPAAFARSRQDERYRSRDTIDYDGDHSEGGNSARGPARI